MKGRCCVCVYFYYVLILSYSALFCSNIVSKNWTNLLYLYTYITKLYLFCVRVSHYNVTVNTSYNMFTSKIWIQNTNTSQFSAFVQIFRIFFLLIFLVVSSDLMFKLPTRIIWILQPALVFLKFVENSQSKIFIFSPLNQFTYGNSKIETSVNRCVLYKQTTFAL